jgi:hypothetical protein
MIESGFPSLKGERGDHNTTSAVFLELDAGNELFKI